MVLGHSFREGKASKKSQETKHGEPLKLSCVEPLTFQILMNIIHEKESKIPKCMEDFYEHRKLSNAKDQMTALLQFSLVVKKYELQSSVGEYVESWLSHLET